MKKRKLPGSVPRFNRLLLLVVAVLLINILISQAIPANLTLANPYPQPDISVTPTSIKFGSITPLSQSPPETVTISNIGTANLTIDIISIVGIAAGQFFISSDNASGQSLPPGTSANVSVTFYPKSAGTKLARLEIPSNDPDHSKIYV